MNTYEAQWNELRALLVECDECHTFGPAKEQVEGADGKQYCSQACQKNAEAAERWAHIGAELLASETNRALREFQLKKTQPSDEERQAA